MSIAAQGNNKFLLFIFDSAHTRQHIWHSREKLYFHKLARPRAGEQKRSLSEAPLSSCRSFFTAYRGVCPRIPPSHFRIPRAFRARARSAPVPGAARCRRRYHGVPSICAAKAEGAVRPPPRVSASAIRRASARPSAGCFRYTSAPRGRLSHGRCGRGRRAAQGIRRRRWPSAKPRLAFSSSISTRESSAGRTENIPLRQSRVRKRLRLSSCRSRL